MATATQSIGEIVRSQPAAAAILRRFEIDVCAQAGASLGEACAHLQLSLQQVLEKLEDGAAMDAGEHAEPREFGLGRLIQHIVRVHHRNVRQALPQLVELSHAVADEYGARAPQLKQIEALLEELHAEMTEHIRKEEQTLFPYIAQAEEAPLIAFRPPLEFFSRVGQPLFMMVQEHERARLQLDVLRTRTDDFTAPAWASPRLGSFYAELRAFNESLLEHIRLENEVLFPRAMEMEAELMRGGAR